MHSITKKENRNRVFVEDNPVINYIIKVFIKIVGIKDFKVNYSLVGLTVLAVDFSARLDDFIVDLNFAGVIKTAAITNEAENYLLRVTNAKKSKYKSG